MNIILVGTEDAITGGIDIEYKNLVMKVSKVIKNTATAELIKNQK